LIAGESGDAGDRAVEERLDRIGFFASINNTSQRSRSMFPAIAKIGTANVAASGRVTRG
jgi:hypothetical protein